MLRTDCRDLKYNIERKETKVRTVFCNCSTEVLVSRRNKNKNDKLKGNNGLGKAPYVAAVASQFILCQDQFKVELTGRRGVCVPSAMYPIFRPVVQQDKV